MLLAGLGIDIYALVKLFSIVFRLTIVPTVVEVLSIAVLSVFTLNLPWTWGFLLGFDIIPLKTFTNIIYLFLTHLI